MSIETVQTGYPGQPWTLIAFITRKPGTSREEFSLHWQKTHAVLVAPWAEKWGIIKYRQIHFDDKADPMFNPPGSTERYDIIPYDGIVEIVAPSPEVYAEAMKDPYYTDVLMQDEARFFVQKAIVVGTGGGNLVIDNAKPVGRYSRPESESRKVPEHRD